MSGGRQGEVEIRSVTSRARREYGTMPVVGELLCEFGFWAS